MFKTCLRRETHCSCHRRDHSLLCYEGSGCSNLSRKLHLGAEADPTLVGEATKPTEDDQRYCHGRFLPLCLKEDGEQREQAQTHARAIASCSYSFYSPLFPPSVASLANGGEEWEGLALLRPLP